MRLQRIGKKVGLSAAVAMTLFSASVSTVYALPTDGTVKSGKAAITTAGDVMNIETSDRVAIDWKTFNIEKNETVNFIQPNANSIALNRVTGNEMSHIYGNLNANGKVFLINGAGVLFGEGASINVGGLVASTGELNDNVMTNFNKGYDYSLTIDKNASIINQTKIAAINDKIRDEGGLVVLHAANVTNEGTIQTGNGGIVQLDACKKLNINYDSDKINFTVTVDEKSGLKAADVLNAGTISAQNGIIAMTARSADRFYSSVVNQASARLEAKGLAKNEKGEIILAAETVKKTFDTSWGVVDVKGKVDVSGSNGADGGKITVSGRSICVDGALNASGANGGTINCMDAAIIVTDDASADAGATNGANGKWTIDCISPVDKVEFKETKTVDIKKSAALDLDTTDANYTRNLYDKIWRDISTISNTVISNALAGADVNITAHEGRHLVSDIVISDDITKADGAATKLTLAADRNVVFGGAVKSDKELNIETKTGQPIMLEQGNRDGEIYGANIIWKNINTKGDISLGGNTFVGILDGTSESGRGISGNNVTLGGDVVVAVADILEINAENDVKIEGSLNSGNTYTGGSIEGMTYLKVNGKVNYWETARQAAKNDTPGGSDVGDSYLVTIADGLEDSAVAAVLPDRKKEAYSGGRASDWVETGETRSRQWAWGDGPEAGQVYFIQTSERNYGTGYQGDAVSGHAVTDVNGTAGYVNFTAGEPNNDGVGQPVMSVGFNNYDKSWTPSHGEKYTMSRWDDAYEGSGSSYFYYIRETNLADSSLKINAGGEIEVQEPIGNKRKLKDVIYQYNHDDAAVIRLDELQITEMMVSPSAVQGSAGIEDANSARVSDVDKVAGLMDGQLPFYKAKGNRIIPEG
ncbi:MAG: filamentous hemagglutinin N-terminal domain-containing protein, partial [Schwartzia sp.]|nr:filamentous hemagglutinin N-terminal domain-containing protein [Schwartzia sp. (in: firmicutes)]